MLGKWRTCARSCFRRGEADARITRLPRIACKAGSSRGNRARAICCRGGAGAPAATGVCSASALYAGGASEGIFRSDIGIAHQFLNGLLRGMLIVEAVNFLVTHASVMLAGAKLAGSRPSLSRPPPVGVSARPSFCLTTMLVSDVFVLSRSQLIFYALRSSMSVSTSCLELFHPLIYACPVLFL